MRNFLFTLVIFTLTITCFSQENQDFLPMNATEILPSIDECDESKNRTASRDCLTAYIQNFLVENFKNQENYLIQLKKMDGIRRGLGHYVIYIGSDGKVAEVKIFRMDPLFEQFTPEIKMIYEKLPPFKPAKQRGKDVGVAIYGTIGSLTKRD